MPQESNYFLHTNERTGLHKELPSYTCVHCDRVIILNPERTRARNQCRKCMKIICDSAGCVVGCNPFQKDLERSYQEQDNQPWLLRHHGEPVDRIYDEYGNELLVLRKDNGMTNRALQKVQRE